MKWRAISKPMLLGLLVTLGAGPAPALEIQATTESGGQTYLERGSFRLECWQGGNRIINQTGLQAMTLGAALKGRTVSFRQPGGQGASVVLIPFEHSLCFTSSE